MTEPTTEMTNDQALSVLSRLDAEQRTFDQLNAARKHVSGVLQRYQTVLNQQAEKERELRKLQDAIQEAEATATRDHQRRRQEMAKELSDMKTKLQGELDSLTARVASAKTAAEKAEADAATTIRSANEKKQQASKDAELLEQRVEGLKKELAALRAKHGLG